MSRFRFAATIAVLAMGLIAASAQAAPLGSITEFSAGLNAGANPRSIASGSDGSLWFTDIGTTKAIGRIAPSGTVTEFPLPSGGGPFPATIVPGPDGSLWFTNPSSPPPTIGRITPVIGTGTLTSGLTSVTSVATTGNFTVGSSIFGTGIPAGATITAVSGTTLTLSAAATATATGVTLTAATITQFPVPDTVLNSIAPGPDGNLWFINQRAVNEIQTVTIGGGPTGGTFTLTFNGQTTTPLPFNATSTEVETALGALSTIGGTANVGVSGSYTVTFEGALQRTNVPQMTCDGSGLTGGTPTCTVATTTAGDSNKIGRITTTGTITEFTAGLNAVARLEVIAPGPDGNLWFTDRGIAPSSTPAIGRITPSGTITEFSAGLNAGASPRSIASGSDGNLWFADIGTTLAIGRITTAGAITEFAVPAGVFPTNVAPGPDGNIWFADLGIFFGGENKIGRITPSGAITEFSAGLNPGNLPVGGVLSGGITPGPDGNLWFTDGGTTKAIGRIGAGAPPASLRAPSVVGSLQEQTQQTCGTDRWADWAGGQPFDGGLLESSTTPPPVQWLLNGSPVAGPAGTARTYTPGVGSAGEELSCTENVTYRYPLNVTVPASSSPVTLIEQSQGPTGPTGTNGTDGADGANGAVGPAGAQGAQGPAGPAGRDAKVTCTVKKKGTKVKVTCKVQVVASASSSRLRWRLMRSGKAYAHGTARARRRLASINLELSDLQDGRYQLHLQGRKGETTIVVR
jgi:streptogramin lyase